MRQISFFIILFSLCRASALPPGAKFYWNFEGDVTRVPLTYDVYDLDLDEVRANPTAVRRLHQAGKTLVCYFSAGTYENWRIPNPYKNVKKTSIGKAMGGWDERWLDIRQADVRAAQLDILKAAKKAGCDAVDPDNTDHYGNDTGFRITQAENVEYLHWLAAAAHAAGLPVGLKNTQELVARGALQKHFDFQINEQCFTYRECDPLVAFTQEGKGVFILEYKTTHESAPYNMNNFARDCARARRDRFTLTVFRTQNLNGDIYRHCE